MPFGLKNTVAIYQHLVNKMFREQIGKDMEVYVGEMLVKGIQVAGHIHKLEETFQTLRKYDMNLNHLKCAFEVSSGKFLGFVVSGRGIEANLEKVQAVLDIQSPHKTKQLQ
jgi:hypothetical protein